MSLKWIKEKCVKALKSNILIESGWEMMKMDQNLLSSLQNSHISVIFIESRAQIDGFCIFLWMKWIFVNLMLLKVP